MLVEIQTKRFVCVYRETSLVASRFTASRDEGREERTKLQLIIKLSASRAPSSSREPSEPARSAQEEIDC
jgi:hypothetical protein